MNTKKVLLGILVLLLILIAGAALADVDGNYTYTVSGNEATIIAYSGTGLAPLTVPTTLGGYPVTHIGSDAFAEKSFISVTVPGSIRSIGERAFQNCSRLQSVTLSSGLITIGDYAFSYTKMGSVAIPETTTSIGDYAFAFNNNLKTLTMDPGGSLVHIGCRAFQFTEISSVTVPGTVQTIGDYAFSQCEKLETVMLEAGVEGIGYGAFQNDYMLKTVNLAGGLKTIGGEAFYNCGALQNITIPSGVVSIGNYAFGYTSQLRNITIPDTVLLLGEYAFCYSNLSDGITLSSGLTTIQTGTFGNCMIKSIIIPNNVTRIGESAFYECRSLENITLSNKLNSIGEGAFINCEMLKLLELPDSMSNLYRCLNGCYSAVVVVPDSFTLLEEEFDDVRAVLGSSTNTWLVYTYRFGFADTRSFVYTYFNGDEYDDQTLRVVDYVGTATDATLPNNVSIINNNAFAKCTQLKKLTLPDTGIKSIGANAFHDGLQVICTAGSTTHQMLVADGYPVEVDGYPGLYAVAKNDGNLYNARYYGNASIIDLPDNIASTLPCGEEIINGYDENTATWTEQRVSHPAMFPASTRYRTTYNSLTAQTLGKNGYFITVAGMEDYGFTLNSVPAYAGYGEISYSTYSPFISSEIWLLTAYYGTDQDLVLPAGTEYVYLVNMPQVNSITTTDNTLREIIGYVNGGITSHKIYYNPEIELILDVNTYESWPYDLYPTGQPDYVCGYNDAEYKPIIRRYVGAATEFELTGEEFFIEDNYGVEPDAFNNVRLYIKGNPDITVQYQYENPNDYYNKYTILAATAYTGTTNEVTLDENFMNFVRDIGNLPDTLKIYCDGANQYFQSNNFVTRSFYLAGKPDFAFRYDEYGYGSYFYRYTGSADMVVIDDVLGMRFDENAIPNNVKPYISINTPIWPHETAEPGMFVNRSFYIVGYPDIEMRTSLDTITHGESIYRYTGSAKEIHLGDDFYATGIFENAIPNDVKIYCSLTSMATCAFTNRIYYAPDNQEFEYMTENVDIATMESTPVLYAYTGSDTEITMPAGTSAIKSNAIPSTVKTIHVDNMLPDDAAARILGNYILYASMDSPLVRNGGLSYWDENAWGEFGSGAECHIGLIDPNYPGVVYTVEGSICLAGTFGGTVRLPGLFTSLSSDIQRQYNEWVMNVTVYQETDENGNPMYDEEHFTPFSSTVYVHPNTATARLLNNYSIPYNVCETKKSYLPNALTTIEEEAFMNSNFEEVIIGSKCTTIGARAFADSKQLAVVHIPVSVQNIDETAFSGCVQMTICCKSGSAAETYAINHGIPHVNE